MHVFLDFHLSQLNTTNDLLLQLFHALLFYSSYSVDFVLKDPHEIDKEPIPTMPPHRLELVE